MDIYVGGAFQGKLEYALKMQKEENPLRQQKVFHGACDALENIEDYTIIRDVHLLIKRLMDTKNQDEIVAFLEALYQKKPEIIFICDEVGSGIVPIEKTERQYREMVGRVMCRLVLNATRVFRVTCGVGMRIK